MDKYLEAFFIVWSPTGPTNPSYRHEVRAHAVTEAERLARLHPGSEFYVMQADTMRKVNDMIAVDYMSPDIPF